MTENRCSFHTDLCCCVKETVRNEQFCSEHLELYKKAEEICPICLDDLLQQETITFDTCKHTVHVDCFYQSKKLICPLCRSEPTNVDKSRQQEGNDEDTFSVSMMDTRSIMEIMIILQEERERIIRESNLMYHQKNQIINNSITLAIFKLTKLNIPLIYIPETMNISLEDLIGRRQKLHNWIVAKTLQNVHQMQCLSRQKEPNRELWFYRYT